MNIKTIFAVPAIVLVGVVAAVFVAITVQTATASAQTKPDTTKNQKSNNDDKKAASKDVTYKYVAQSGDSYSKIARKAVQTYGLKYKVNLSVSRIIYAETHLTQEAGSPLLNLGQEVTVSESTVKGWVEKAQKLSNDEAAKWDVYVSNVNFNTDNVGESR